MLAIHSFRYVVNNKHVACLSSRPSRAVRTGPSPFSLSDASLCPRRFSKFSTKLLTLVHNRASLPEEGVLHAVDSRGSVFDQTTATVERFESLHWVFRTETTSRDRNGLIVFVGSPDSVARLGL